MIDQLQRQHVIGDAIAAFREIGYRASWMRQGFEFADFYSSGTPSRTIDLGIFGQAPLDYRSACFGIQFQHEESEVDAIERIRALGAPQILYVRNGVTQRWQIRADDIRLTEEFSTGSLSQRILSSKETWSPQAVLRAKSGFKREARQQDFVDLGLLPALEHEAARKIDQLVKCACAITESYYSSHNGTFDAGAAFSVIFQLLVGKLLYDRRIKTVPAIDFSKPETVLSAVRNHYPSHDHSALRRGNFSATLIRDLVNEISNSFSFANLSVETLTYVYENTFVSDESRKSLGIHSTPSYLADYVLSQIAIEEIPRRNWHVLDPTCGHGIFLIAAMRRMRALLPAEWSGRQRHEFFASHLHGIDCEKFSLEVAQLCLMLADFPEANGWDLKNTDVFKGKLLEEHARQATILVGNPPFEAFPGQKPLVRKPAELLRRTLTELQAGSYMGMVLPKAFLDSSEYTAQRRALLDGFDILSVTSLTDKIFKHADAETAVVVARKGKTGNTFVTFREVVDNDAESFRHSQKLTWEDSVPGDFFLQSQNGRFIVPVLREVWDYLSENQRFEAIAEIRTGIRYKTEGEMPNRGDVFFSRPGSYRRLGIDKVSESYNQYVCDDGVYFSMRESVMENAAWQYDWDAEKVIVPASRNSRGPWRYAAVLDTKGRCCSRRFYAVWPKVETGATARFLAALLNSPVAMAYAYAHSFQKDITVRVYECIPIPDLRRLEPEIDVIAGLVDRYIAVIQEPLMNEPKAREVLLRIDAELLKLYSLPPRLERKLLDLFWGIERRVPFSFGGYIPPEYKPWIPLHKYLAPQFAAASAKNVMQRMPEVSGPEILHLLDSLSEN